jgi:hypothetical protein
MKKFWIILFKDNTHVMVFANNVEQDDDDNLMSVSADDVLLFFDKEIIDIYIQD